MASPPNVSAPALGAAQNPSANFNSVSLYVGDLHPDVTEALLYEVFSAVGPVASIRVCRDAITRRSLGYAYVNFHSPNDAERALDTMNYTLIKDKPCRIMWSQRDPAMRKSGMGNIFIKNLDKTIDNKALYDTFSAFGNILSCKVAEADQGDGNKVSLGYGFVHFETQEAADMAIEKVNGMLLAGKKVFVGTWKPKKERMEELGEAAQKFTNVFVKNLPEDVDDAALRNMFAEFGEVTSAAVSADAEGKARGFGFVSFGNTDAAHKAVEAMNGKEVNGKTLYVGRHQKRAEREAELKQKYAALKQERASKFHNINLYIKNLDDTVDEDKLREMFAPFGTITSHKIMRDDKGNSRGFGFVCFSTPEEATKAVMEMSGKMLGSKPLYVTLAQRRDERQAQLATQYAHRAAGMRMAMPAMPAYPGGAPLFYTGPGVPPGVAGRPGMVYPQMPVPRPRWAPPVAGAARPAYQAMPNYMPQMPRPAAMRARPPAGGPRPPAQPKGPQGPPPRGFKYAPNVRNVPGGPAGQMAAPAPIPAAAVPPVIPGQEPLTASMLAQASPEQQKQLLGERLFPIIQQTHPDLAGKITGMLLEMDNSELLHLLESREALSQKVAEAVAVLNAHQGIMAEGAQE